MHLICDAASLTALINRLLAARPDRVVQSVGIEVAASRVRLILRGVRTGLSMFGMTVPPVDGWLLLTGTWRDGELHLVWEVEKLEGVPSMAASLVGKPALAKLLLSALGTRWGADRALRADAQGDLWLKPQHLTLAFIPGGQLTRVDVTADLAAVLRLEWNVG